MMRALILIALCALPNCLAALPPIVQTKASVATEYAEKLDIIQAEINNIQAQIESLSKRSANYVGEGEALDTALRKAQNELEQLNTWYNALPALD